jgi:multidrug resistance efflux pump
VEPAREIQLSPQVRGQIISMAEQFIPGGFVKEGEVLLEIDPADYRNNLAMRQSELHQAQAELEQELGQQRAAQQEFALLGEEIEEANQSPCRGCPGGTGHVQTGSQPHPVARSIRRPGSLAQREPRFAGVARKLAGATGWYR